MTLINCKVCSNLLEKHSKKDLQECNRIAIKECLGSLDSDSLSLAIGYRDDIEVNE